MINSGGKGEEIVKKWVNYFMTWLYDLRQSI